MKVHQKRLNISQKNNPSMAANMLDKCLKNAPRTMQNLRKDIQKKDSDMLQTCTKKP